MGELLLHNDIELERFKSNWNEIHMQLHKLDKSVQIWCGVSSLPRRRRGDPSCYFRLAAACPDRGVMGGKEGGGIFSQRKKIFFFHLLKVLGKEGGGIF